MIFFALSLVVLVAAVCEFVAWLRYPGGGTRRVTHDEVRRVEAER